MNQAQRINYIYDATGELESVNIPASLWRKLAPSVDALLQIGAGEPSPKDEPFEEFETFLRVWDFPYTYDYAVKCPACNTQTANWRDDADKPFYLANANIGGLLVFHCAQCGATIRHKYFKDHMAVEYTPAGL